MLCIIYNYIPIFKAAQYHPLQVRLLFNLILFKCYCSKGEKDDFSQDKNPLKPL